MTDEQIQETVDAINKVGERIKGSKELSLKFLIDAGIIKEKKEVHRKKDKRVQESPSRSHGLPQLQ